MTDSVRRKPEENTAEAITKRLAKYERKPASKRETPDQLPRWVKTALIQHAVDGLSYRVAAERFGRAGSTLREYAKSPAAKIWIASLQEFLEDPVAMAKAYMGANAFSITLDRFVFLQAAMDAGDYKEGDRIARDLQDRIGLIAKKQDSGAIQVKIQLGAGGLDAPVIEADYEVED